MKTMFILLMVFFGLNGNAAEANLTVPSAEYSYTPPANLMVYLNDQIQKNFKKSCGVSRDFLETVGFALVDDPDLEKVEWYLQEDLLKITVEVKGGKSMISRYALTFNDDFSELQKIEGEIYRFTRESATIISGTALSPNVARVYGATQMKQIGKQSCSL